MDPTCLAMMLETAGAGSARVWFYAGFVLLVGFFLALDLGVFNRSSHHVSVREAFAWTAVWVSTALAFSVLVYFMYQHHWQGFGQQIVTTHGSEPRDVGGGEATSLFLMCWALEYALSLDNIFVIAVIFRHFKVASEHQHRVLFWGILGALIMRGLMIGIGAAIVSRFHWVVYLLGGFLIYTGIAMLRHRDEEIKPQASPLVRIARRIFPLAPHFDGQRFFTFENGRRVMTPMFLVLLVVETTDVMFAVDSIPAAFGVTSDPFIVFTSNIFAILGLRSLYFALAAFMGRFEHLKYSLAFILAFIGVKMLLPLFKVELTNSVSLSVIGGALAVGVLSSLAFPPKTTNEKAPTQD